MRESLPSVEVAAGLVSVVIPAYNASKYIQQTILSVLAQDYNNIQIVVVDDGSQDQTCSIVRNIDAHIMLVSQKNGGPSKARNVGIAHSSGEYIWHLDADDVLLPGAITLAVGELTKYPVIAGVIGQWSIIDSYGHPTSGSSTPWILGIADKSSLYGPMLVRTIFPPSAAIFRRKAIESVGGWDEALWCAEDRDLWLRLLQDDQQVLFVEDEYMRYRLHPDNSTLNIARVESHFCLFMERWFGVNGLNDEEYAHLGPYAWCVSYLYMARQCEEKQQLKDIDRFQRLAAAYLTDATPDPEQVKRLLWDDAGGSYNREIRSILWPKSGIEVADYCWAIGAQAIRTVKPLPACRWIAEILVNRPCYLVGKLRSFWPGRKNQTKPVKT